MPILLANQLLLQSAGDVVLMTVGQVAHPALTGPDDPRGNELAQRGEVPVRPVIRVALTPKSAAEFAKAAVMRPKIVGEALQAIAKDKDVAEALFTILETEKIIESEATITLIPSNLRNDVLSHLQASMAPASKGT